MRGGSGLQSGTPQDATGLHLPGPGALLNKGHVKRRQQQNAHQSENKFWHPSPDGVQVH